MATIPIDLKTGTLKDSENYIFGIDLGTTNSLISYIKNGKPTIFKLPNEENGLVPSVIYFDANGIAKIGIDAKNHLISDPINTIYSVKRLMGRTTIDSESWQNNLNYQVIQLAMDAPFKIVSGGKYYTPTELSSIILSELKNRVESHLNIQVSKCVITVPAYFDDAQRQATKDAGKLAGLEVLKIINEPTSAALSYGLNKLSDPDEIIAVYDFGGGTFDVSLLHLEDGIFEVISTRGDTSLGGDDIDNAIVEYWLNKYKSISLLKEIMPQLRLAAEEAKISLSKEKSYKKFIKEESIELTKDELQTLIYPIISKTLTALTLAIEDAKIHPNQ